MKLRRKIWTRNIGISVAKKKEVVQTITVAETCQREHEEKVYGGKLGEDKKFRDVEEVAKEKKKKLSQK